MKTIEELVGRVLSGPSGKSIAAFFDFDGTLIDGYSASAFYRERLRSGDMGFQELAHAIRLGLRGEVGETEFARFVEHALRGFAGREESELEELGRRLFRQEIAACLYPEAWRLVQAHRHMGHTVVIASSATQFQVAPMAQELGLDNVLCTRADVRDGLLTGHLRGPALWGRGKTQAVRDFASRRALDLARSYAYANGDEDIPFLATAGAPCAVNPRARLARAAAQHQWPTIAFAPRRRLGLAARTRTAASYAAMAGAFAGGLGLRLLGTSRQDAVNLIGTLGSEMGLAIAGVRVNVQGEKHLWAHRPAVFIVNHQSGLDMLVAFKLLRRDFTGVAKKEAANAPGFGAFMRMADVAFLDRGNTAQARAALAPAVDRLRSGISLAIAPEGTRSPTPQPGAFKKGAFHIAMQAGVPIVPIVVRNAGEIMWRNSLIMRPGTVDVAVLPPISVARWKPESLDRHVESVRRRFVATLENWPEPRR